MVLNGLEQLGFEPSLLDEIAHEDRHQFEVARVVAVHKDGFTINAGQADVYAEMSGKMLYSAVSAMDYPVVGDWVLAALLDQDTFSVIHRVLPRASLLKRKTSGKKIDFQMIAANIDVAFVVQSLDRNFNLSRLERYLVMISSGNIRPIVLLSKSDLLDADQIADRISDIHEVMPDLSVLPFSNQNESTLKPVEELMSPRRTYCLLGSSGVGKTTLVNNLDSNARYSTRTVREKDSKGRHATTYRQLIMLDCGALLIDTPGMRELGNFSITSGMDETFTDIAELAEACRFNNCTHVNEKGCAVLMAVDKGHLQHKRYLNYMKLKKESDYYDLSYYEKRVKEKEFAKMCKSVMKYKKNRR